MRHLLHEPVVHFFLIALLLLGGNGIYQSHFQPAISLNQEEIDAMVLADNFEQKRQGSEADAKGLVRNYIQNEILYREAIKRDMAASKAVKTLMIQQLQKELEPVVREPSDAELRQIYQLKVEQYQLPRQVSFIHVSFQRREAIPGGLLEKLNAGQNPAQYGESVRLANPLPLTYETQLERTLGKAASDAIFALPAGQWFGPIASERGLHFVRILQHVDKTAMPFDMVRNTLKVNWIRDKKRQAIEAALKDMSQAYRIDVPAAYRDTLP